MKEVQIQKIKKYLPPKAQDEIAKAANTTVVTVSRAWNSYQNGRVKEETKELIFAETMRYFLSLYETEFRDIAKDIRKSMRVPASQ
jgi:hypothetical protein